MTSQPIARTWTPPDISKIPAGPDGDSILLGMHIFEETPRYAPNYVGNQLSCGSCHLAGGTMSYGIALVGAPSWFPMHSDRAKRDITLEDRIQECVTRSENGTPLPQGGREVTALISYMTWISQQGAAEGLTPVRGVDAKIATLQGDATRGEAIYKEQCSGCHGADGAGVVGVLPALWGPGSYNNGAGMNQPEENGRLRPAQHAAEQSRKAHAARSLGRLGLRSQQAALTVQHRLRQLLIVATGKLACEPDSEAPFLKLSSRSAARDLLFRSC